MSAEPSRCTMQRHKQLTLQRCKTNIASNAKHPFLDNDRGFSTVSPQAMPAVSLAVCNLSLHFNDSDVFSRYLYL